ncbi:MAG: hypothetical protein KDK91_08095 [Gammaproteobacteria bacterium]|nr:hypothetical protein [Gammaproteobacteria bacterium]
MSKVIGLFPTPLMHCERLLDDETVAQLRERARADTLERNSQSGQLSHTRLLDPSTDPLFARVQTAAIPDIGRFGELLFGEPLAWAIKEMWLNVLEPGGSQFIHSHANSFVSGIVYLNRPHPSTHTVFMKSPGSGEFIFKNDAAGQRPGQFGADRWVLPEVSPGDMVLYPSYLLHGVPPNQGAQRITLAFNAIPERLRSLGYDIYFAGTPWPR